MGINQIADMGMVATGNPGPIAKRMFKNAGEVGLKDVAMAQPMNPAGIMSIGKKLMFGGGSSPAEKRMMAAAKAAKKQKLIDNFGPNMLKAQKDGRNTVSAKRALRGERIVSSAYKPLATSGGSDRGILGNRMQRNKSIADALSEEKQFKDAKVFESIEKEQAHAKLVSGQDNNVVHQVHALRNEKSALIQGNHAGYDNPRLVPVPRRSGAAARPPAPHMPQTWRNQTFDNTPNRTGASKALASRMSNYR